MRKLKRGCAYPGCPNLTDGIYCDVHKPKANRNYNKYTRSPDHYKKYGTEWRRIREQYAQAHPLCEMCLKEGKLTPVEEVHHILPVERGGTHDESNLMSLCKSCHTKIHIELGDRNYK